MTIKILLPFGRQQIRICSPDICGIIGRCRYLIPCLAHDACMGIAEHHIQGRSESDSQEGTRLFLERHVMWAVAAISIVLAAILLVGAISSLYFVTGPAARLGMIGGFTVLFAPSVGATTNAKRAEVFAATAAYAAVLVVFVSGDLGRTNSASRVLSLQSGPSQ
jgi:hypothetical protein